MKKGLFIVAMCLIAMVVALPAAYAKINSEKESVRITEEVVSGDPLAAEGIKLNVATHWEGHMLWDTQYTIGSEETISDFEFASDEVTWKSKESENIHIDYVTNFGTAAVAGSTRRHEVYLENMWLSEITMAVAERTAPGETHTETVKIADYYEYYPITFYVSSGKRDVYYSYYKEEELFMELFHIKTSEDDMIEVSITKDRTGIVTGLKCEEADYSGWAADDAEAFAENGCYYTYACTDWNTGKYLECGENRGIFYMPYEYDRYGISIAKDKIEKVCDLPERSIPVKMLLDEEGGMLYLLVKVEEDYYLYICELKGHVPVIKDVITVLESKERQTFSDMTIEEGGIFIKWHENIFAFISAADGEYKLWCQDIFPVIEGETDKTFLEEHALLYDGERLLLASFVNENSTNVQLAVYSEDGQEYCGIYHNSSELDDEIIPQGAFGIILEKKVSG